MIRNATGQTGDERAVPPITGAVMSRRPALSVLAAAVAASLAFAVPAVAHGGGNGRGHGNGHAYGRDRVRRADATSTTTAARRRGNDGRFVVLGTVRGVDASTRT